MARQRSDKAVPAPASAGKGATGGLPASAGESKRKTTTARTGSAKKTTRPARTKAKSGTSAAGSTAKVTKSGQTAGPGLDPSPKRQRGVWSPTVEQIRQRAYEIHLGRGGAPGDDLADWLQAEGELRLSNSE